MTLRTPAPLSYAVAAWLAFATACASSNPIADGMPPEGDSGGIADVASAPEGGDGWNDAGPTSDGSTPDDGGGERDAASTSPEGSSSWSDASGSDGGTGSESGTVGVQDASSMPVVTVDPTKPGRAIADTFLGFSCEWGTSVRTIIGDGSGHALAPTVQLFKNFATDGIHPPLRVGGNSADEAYYAPTGGTLPSGTTIPIKSTDIASLADLNAKAGTSLIPNLNLVLGDVANSTALIQALTAAVPTGTIRAFEVGNEPDNWVAKGLRPAGFSFTDWTTQYDAMTAGMSAALKSSPPYAGPATFTPGPWFEDVDGLYAHEKTNLSLATLHRYPYTNCSGDTSRPTATTPAALLAAQGTSALVSLFAPRAAAAQAANVELRVGEFNSIACSGVAGVSDTYAEALWAADATLELATAGVSAVNFHMSASSSTTTVYYDPWQYSGSKLTVLPLYYGLRLASMAMAQGGKLLPVSVKASAAVHAFATLGSDGAVRVLLVNLDPSNGGTVSLDVSGAKSASLIRMHAPMLSAKTGITLGTQTWDGSADGNPMGTSKPEGPLAIQGETISAPLPALDAVVVTVTM